MEGGVRSDGVKSDDVWRDGVSVCCTKLLLHLVILRLHTLSQKG